MAPAIAAKLYIWPNAIFRICIHGIGQMNIGFLILRIFRAARWEICTLSFRTEQNRFMCVWWNFGGHNGPLHSVANSILGFRCTFRASIMKIYENQRTSTNIQPREGRCSEVRPASLRQPNKNMDQTTTAIARATRHPRSSRDVHFVANSMFCFRLVTRRAPLLENVYKIWIGL